MYIYISGLSSPTSRFFFPLPPFPEGRNRGRRGRARGVGRTLASPSSYLHHALPLRRPGFFRRREGGGGAAYRFRFFMRQIYDNNSVSPSSEAENMPRGLPHGFLLTSRRSCRHAIPMHSVALPPPPWWHFEPSEPRILCPRWFKTE